MTTDTLELIFKQAQQLPPESLADLAKYVEFLRFKTRSAKSSARKPDVNTLAKLEGILTGVDVSPEALAEARREMWRGFGDLEL